MRPDNIDDVWDMYERMKLRAETSEQLAALFVWLESRRGLDLRTDNMEWTRPDGTKFKSSHNLCANGTQHAPYPTLRETILAAMGI
jgi:hypothetical protein